MRNELISIVIPIYNVEKYLPRCLDSIVGQTYTNIEVMLVDDGSPDNAGKICDEYAANDSRIKVFHIPNGGVAKARELGVNKSTGDYIVFVDPDDWLTLEAIDTMYKYMEDEISIVVSSYIRVFEDTQFNYIHPKELCARDQYIEKLLLSKMNMGPWCKLYRRCLFQDKSFPVFKRGQDKLMNIKISLSVDKVLFISEITNYYLYSRQDSTSNKTIVTFDEKRRMLDYVYSVFSDNNEVVTFELPLALHSLSVLISAIGDGQIVNSKDYQDTLQVIKKYKLPRVYSIIAIVVKNKFLQKCYLHFRKLVASNVAIRRLMFKMR